MDQPLYSQPSFNDLQDEIFFAQNLPSLLVAHNLFPSPGDTILDMCAAPGKSLDALLCAPRNVYECLKICGVKIMRLTGIEKNFALFWNS